MKKITKIFLAIVLSFSLMFSVVPPTQADSGWDVDYDYDYSGGSYGGGYDYSYGSGGGSHSSSSSGDYGIEILFYWLIIWAQSSPLTFIIVALFVMAMLVSMEVRRSRRKSLVTSMPKANSVDMALSVEEIQKVLPDFDYNVFKSQVFDIYKEIQVAWMDFDYDTLRKFTTDELYNAYHSQLVALSLKKQKNVMKDFELVNFRITSIESNANEVALKVYASIRCIDYVEDAEGKVVRGSNKDSILYSYEMTFIKGLGVKDNKCPNCNAPLNNVQSSVCPYCDSVIISDNHDWILSKKEMIKQKK